MDEWERLAGPKSAVQWQDYKSAKECAYAWLGGGGPAGIPEELTRILQAHADFGTILEWEAEPECLVSFDQYAGPANVDVLVTVRDDGGSFVAAIEAKADESFGLLLDRVLSDALERKLTNAASNRFARVEELARDILGGVGKGQPSLHQLRYQLLTTSAAALAHAKSMGANRAVVLVHEFETPRTRRENHDRNSQDLVRFVKRLGIKDAERVIQGELVGPVKVPGGGRFDDPVPLYIGMASRTVRTRDELTPPASNP